MMSFFPRGIFMRHFKALFISILTLITISCANIFTPDDKGRISITVLSGSRSLVESVADIHPEDGKFIISLNDLSGKLIDRKECRSEQSAYFEDVPAGKYTIEAAFTCDGIEDTTAYIKKEIVVLGGQENVVNLPLKANTLDKTVDVKIHYHGNLSFDNENALKEYFSSDLPEAATGFDLILSNGWTEIFPNLNYLPENIEKNISLLLEDDGQPIVQEKSDITIYTIKIEVTINSKEFSKNIEIYIPKEQRVETGGTPCTNWEELKTAIEKAENDKETLITLTGSEYEISAGETITIGSGKKIIIEPGTSNIPIIRPAASDGLTAFFEVNGNLTLRGNEYGILYINGCKDSDTYTISGSAIKVNGGGTVNIGPNVFFSGILSNSGKGAAIKMEDGSTVNITGENRKEVKFIGCITGYLSALGGAIYNNGGTLNISYSSFSGCEANNGDNPVDDHNGGAIYSSGTLSVSNSSFTECIAANNGGAIYVAGGTASLDSVTFGTGEEANMTLGGGGTDYDINKEGVESFTIDGEKIY